VSPPQPLLVFIDERIFECGSMIGSKYLLAAFVDIKKQEVAESSPGYGR